jgi:hypothetical protein
MLHKSTRTNDSSATAALEPDIVADMRKTEMKQAILERFCYRAKAVTPDVQAKPRSPYWQPVDYEC